MSFAENLGNTLNGVMLSMHKPANHCHYVVIGGEMIVQRMMRTIIYIA